MGTRYVERMADWLHAQTKVERLAPTYKDLFGQARLA